MSNIKIIRGVFDTKLELQHAGVKAGFPSPAKDYIHETLDFRSNLFACPSKNRDYIRHPEASFYGWGNDLRPRMEAILKEKEDDK